MTLSRVFFSYLKLSTQSRVIQGIKREQSIRNKGNTIPSSLKNNTLFTADTKAAWLQGKISTANLATSRQAMAFARDLGGCQSMVGLR